MARSLAAVRDAGWVEVTLDAAGKSDYFGSASRTAAALARKRWQTITGRRPSARRARVNGNVIHKERAASTSTSALGAKGEGSQREQPDAGETGRPVRAIANERDLTDAYTAAHAAAVKKDWNALLAAIGFDATQPRRSARSRTSTPTWRSSPIASSSPAPPQTDARRPWIRAGGRRELERRELHRLLLVRALPGKAGALQRHGESSVGVSRIGSQ